MDLIKLNEEIDKQFQHLNMIVVGKTGVGKSTLLNACFGEKLAHVDIGEPVTQEIKCHQIPNYPLRIYDTIGLELGNVDKCVEDINNLYDEKIKKNDLDDFIHIMWYCISSEGSRYEPYEIEFINKMSEKLPVIVVLTKTQSQKNGKKLKEKLSEKIKSKIVIVRAEPYEIEDEENEEEKITLKSFGLEELLKETAELIPKAQQVALSSAQKIDLKMKEEQAMKIVKDTCIVNSLGNFFPGSDFFIITPMLSKMLFDIAKIYKVDVLKDINMFVTLISGVIAALVVKLPTNLIANLVKMIPGVGTVAGVLLSGGGVLLITQAIGEIWIKEYMNELYRGKLTEEDMRSQTFIKKFTDSVMRELEAKNFFKKN